MCLVYLAGREHLIAMLRLVCDVAMRGALKRLRRLLDRWMRLRLEAREKCMFDDTMARFRKEK
jgi:hypothetical protein